MEGRKKVFKKLGFLKPMLLSLQPLNRGMEQLVARRAHNPKVVGSSPAPATKKGHVSSLIVAFSFE
jgi:hypothetical protein